MNATASIQTIALATHIASTRLVLMSAGAQKDSLEMGLIVPVSIAESVFLNNKK